MHLWLLLIQEYLGPEIISHFVMHGTTVAEIVKHLISVLKKKDENVPSMFLEALRRVRLALGVLHSMKKPAEASVPPCGLPFFLSMIFQMHYCMNYLQYSFE